MRELRGVAVPSDITSVRIELTTRCMGSGDASWSYACASSEEANR
jgi:hypothetical protein